MLQALDRGVLRDVDKFDFHHSRPVAQLLGSHVVGKNGVVCAASSDPAFDAGREIGHRAPHNAGDRQVRHGHDRLDGLNILHDEAQSAAHVDEACDNALASLAFKDETSGILFVHADAEEVRLDARTARCNGRADLEHMRAEGIFLALDEVIGVVLHKGGAALQTG